MESHCATDCPKAPIACNFSLFGCKEKVSTSMEAVLWYEVFCDNHNLNCLPLQMQRHDLARHMQDFTQMHMHYMADFLRSHSLNGTTPKSLNAIGHSVSFEDHGATASVSSCSKAALSSNCAPCQPTEEMQRLRDMDRRLVKQDHQLRELVILKETQVKDALKSHICTH